MAGGLPNALTVRWVLFGFSGRLSRSSFILGYLLVISIYGLILSRIVATSEAESGSVFWGLAFIAFGLAATWISFALAVKRIKDISQPPILAVLIIMPMLGLLLLLALAIIPSDPKTNAHGAPPFPPINN